MNQKNNPSLDEQIALFRYGIIAPVLYDNRRKQSRYFREAAQKVYDVPGYGRRKYRWKTFKEWLRIYRREGFDGLKPQTRADKGVSRTVDDFLASAIIEKFIEFPTIKVAALYRMLVQEGFIHNGSPGEATVRKFIVENNLTPQAPEPQPRKKFEKPHINDLWLSDFMHAHSFIIDNTRRKLFLCGIIDDHSRLLVGCRWMLHENTEALEIVFKEALLTYGRPKLFYCDNGSVYISAHLQKVCARLGIALLHSKPYDSPPRGKIERFWRTVREGFLSLVSRDKNYSLEQFNAIFAEWLNQHYHRQFHHGIAQTPLDRFLQDQNNVTIRRISQNELELHFYQTYRRKVKNDATISINATLFEVPAKYIGAFVELRHPTGQPFDLWLYENEQPVCKLQKVNLIENSRAKFRGLNFAQNQNNQEE